MKRALLALLLAGLAACTETPVQPPEVSDGAPLRSIHPSDVPDAVPRPDPILAVGNKSPYQVNGETYEILDEFRSYQAEGIASWYGTKFHGQKTSNGEIYDLYAATAAHKTLPIPCYARVTNLENGRSVVVRVNDRGPFHSDRLIDLSYGAAIKLGYMAQGTAPVRVEVLDIAGIDDRRGTLAGSYRFLQVGAYGSEARANNLRDELAALVPSPVFVSPVEANGALLYRVRVGPVADSDELEGVQRTLTDRGYNAGQLLP